jgi:ADP-ribose pyrophosphatase YjhB (NUDIX family)
MRPQAASSEEQALIARYGPTKQWTCDLELDKVGYDYWFQVMARRRRAEVVMIVQRPDKRLLLHTKTHHPPGTYRLPTGGVLWGESVPEALDREQWEEMGVRLSIASMPGIVHYALRHTSSTIYFTSYLFLLCANDDIKPVAQDLTEAISGFRWVSPESILAVAKRLRSVDHTWGGWGPFRAIAHDLLVETWDL